MQHHEARNLILMLYNVKNILKRKYADNPVRDVHNPVRDGQRIDVHNPVRDVHKDHVHVLRV